MKRFMIVIFGLIFIGVSVFLYIKSNNLVKNCTKETLATVVDMKEEFSTDDDSYMYMYFPILEYNVDGKVIRVTMDKGSSTPEYDINEKVTILYNPNNTDEFLVKGDNSSMIYTIIFGVLGVLITGYGIYAIIKKIE